MFGKVVEVNLMFSRNKILFSLSQNAKHIIQVLITLGESQNGQNGRNKGSDSGPQ